jgi:plasmid stabilization system protein ParE
MKRRYILAPQAAFDRVQIWRCIKRESPEKIADRVEAAICDQIISLAQNPSIGHWRKDLADESVKFFPVYSYLIVYRHDTRPLHVVARLQGRRDVPQVLKDRLQPLS